MSESCGRADHWNLLAALHRNRQFGGSVAPGPFHSFFLASANQRAEQQERVRLSARVPNVRIRSKADLALMSAWGWEAPLSLKPQRCANGPFNSVRFHTVRRVRLIAADRGHVFAAY